MNRKRSLKEILGRKKWSQEQAILTLKESEADIWILPEPFESSEGDWYQPDLALVRNKESVLEDLERSAHHCFVKYYLGVYGKRIGRSLRDQYCLPSDLFVDWNFLEQSKREMKRDRKPKKLFVNDDCSFIHVNGESFRLEGTVRACFLLFVNYWRKGVRELAVADILLELNLDQTIHLRKLFRQHNSKRVFNILIHQARHGYYALSVSEVENILDENVVGPMFVQTQSTLNQ